MEIDIGNSLDSVATPGIPREWLDRVDERIAEAHERIERGRIAGEQGYAALDLPSSTDTDSIRRVCSEFGAVDSVLVAGIGGSALGAATLIDAIGADVEVHTLDNVDPARTRAILESVDLDRSVLHIVSRSGRTIETVTGAAAVREAMEQAGLDWTERTVVTTGTEGPLRDLATANDLPVFPVPAGVPGRYAALSTVALPVAAFAGHDISAYLDGARDRRDALSGSLFETPAYAYAATAYGLLQRGCEINVMMPYAESLETFAEWFAQLWAESLGKDGVGQYPGRALGVTDQHSQLQLYRAGPRNLMVTFLRPRTRPTLTVGPAPIDAVADTDLGRIMDAEFEATIGSLAAAGRPTVRLEIEAIEERTVGGLLFELEAACIMVAELLSVNAFDQPAVEWGKRRTAALLGNDADPTDMPGESLVIE